MFKPHLLAEIRRIRAEQDAAFQETLRLDQERERQKLEAEEAEKARIQAEIDRKEDIARGAFTYDVRCFGAIFDLPTYLPLSDIIRCGLTYHMSHQYWANPFPYSGTRTRTHLCTQKMAQYR